MVEIISKGTKMLTQKELFNNAMGRLLTLYKDSPAQLEAVQNTATVASALMEDWTERSIGSMTQAPEINRFGGAKGEYKKQSNTPSTKEAPVEISAEQLNTVKELMMKWVKADPVAFKKFLTNELEPALKEVIEKRYAGAVDDPNKSFEDEVSGKLDKRVDDQKAKEDKKAAEIAKAEEYEKKNEDMDKAKDAEKAQYSSLSKNTGGLLSDEEYEKALNKKSVADNVKEKAGKFKNWLASKAHRLKAKLTEAVESKDAAKLEAVRAEMLEFKSLCEAAGYSVDEVLIG